jgi:hypothetical protein
MFIPDPGSDFFPSRILDLGSQIRIKTQKNGFKALGNMIRVVHPGSGSLLFTHLGSRSQKGTGSWIRIRNTAHKNGLNLESEIQDPESEILDLESEIRD